MPLSTDLISQFAKIVKPEDMQNNKETTVYGTAVEFNSDMYIRLDGSDLLTPVSTTTDYKPGERVTVTIKNHTAIVNGNVSSPSARTDDVKEIGDQISEFEIIIADKVSVIELDAEKGRIDDLQAENVVISETLTAQNADIDDLKTNKLDATIANLTYATVENLDATDAAIYNLDVAYGDFKVLTVNNFTTVNADIDDLDTRKLSADEADIKYADIDFSNIGSAAITELFAGSGLIRDLIVGDGVITGELVGVTIKGDLIEGNTIKADKLVVLGSDGLYYKLNLNGESVEAEQTEYNSLNGSIITAQSITATKINVDDLVAFDATIGGFKITENSIHSGVKSSADNTTRGIYLDDTGQISLGDSVNFFKYYKDIDGSYKLDISADNVNIKVGDTIKSVAESITEVEGRMMITVNVISSNGTALKDGVKQTTLSAIVYNYNTDITDTIPAINFNWLRTSLFKINDEYWNNEYGLGKKNIIITNDDVLEQATFECVVDV